jgi:uncharacterized membrane protein YkvA (DUF1232 family)
MSERAEDLVTIELNPRERRLYDRMRTRVVDHLPGASSDWRDLILLLPDLTVLLTRLLRDPRVPRRFKLLVLAGIGYVVSPIDLMPSLLLGPVGLVDDLLVVTAALSRLLNHVHPDVVRHAWPGQGDALDAIQQVARWSEGLFSDRWKNLLRGVLRLQIR